MKNYFSILQSVFLIGFISIIPAAIAQEALEAPAAVASDASDSLVADINYSYGIVTSVSPEEITLLEYDYDRDEEVQVTYKIDAQTELNNIGSVDKIAQNDEVEIYYVENGGIKLAQSIEKEDLILGEEDLLNEVYDDSAEDVYSEEVPVNEIGSDISY